jgi:predicted flap endonuclease-1-like 5' DNA nuclease
MAEVAYMASEPEAELEFEAEIDPPLEPGPEPSPELTAELEPEVEFEFKSDTPSAPDTAPDTQPEIAPANTVPAPSSLLTERPDEVDDLKRIKGVGPKMEGILNDKGVYLFRQVANFSAEDVAWVNEAIEAFPGRIERDNWVGQAQDLYREKYGRPHDAGD